ncbi:cupin conserved barrel [Colletotrichum chrysophilum]|uniref:Cupin conserved barrel n=1 Tax=Colletotrichum chrysophilum TaxID=1836956 RepID=A0AAD9ALE2_9PEZI|nr:cupin conserved barrel [Colletotrichum chrysophilum]
MTSLVPKTDSSTKTDDSALHDGGDTIHCNDLRWLPLAPKVWIKLVRLSPETGSYTVIVRAEKGGVLPRHRHIESAEIYVIRGDGKHPQTGHFAQGDYVSERKGAVHDPLVFEDEVEMLMMSNGPSAFIDDEGRELFLMDVSMLQHLADSTSEES